MKIRSIMRRCLSLVEGNHNVWHICLSCGLEFDRHLVLDEHCPNCGTPVNQD